MGAVAERRRQFLQGIADEVKPQLAEPDVYPRFGRHARPCRRAKGGDDFISDDVKEQRRAAKACLSGCPFLQPCRLWGVRHERWGVWGGLLPGDRMSIRRVLGIPVWGVVPQTLRYVIQAERQRGQRHER